MTGMSLYEEVGGHETFRDLVAHFYGLVAEDPVLRQLYPEEDLGPAEIRFRMFLEQYWGGPRTYSQQRGHPRLRLRHAPFVIGTAQRDAWLRCMQQAVDSIGPDRLDAAHRATLLDYLYSAADMMVNAAS